MHLPPPSYTLFFTEEFDLHSNQFSGFLPTEFGLLINVDYLVLADNNLAGPIPETLGYAASLIGLSLSNNTMTGTIPTTLGLLENLRMYISWLFLGITHVMLINACFSVLQNSYN